MRIHSVGFSRRRDEMRRRIWAPVACMAAFSLVGGPALCQPQPGLPPVTVPVGANLPTQPLGPNDLIAISVYGAPEFSRTVRLSVEGDIRLPMVEQRIRVAGLMPAEIESAIAKALSSANILVDPVVTVTVMEYQSRPISVAGAVKNPTTFQASGTVTLLEAINRAGGLSPDAGLEILISRRGPDGNPAGPARRVTVRALIDDADPQVNVKLLGGEEIRVPEVSRVFVVGNIKKPGSYPMRDAS